MIFLRTAVWLVVPVTVIALIPHWLFHQVERGAVSAWGVWQWSGAWLIANGLSLMAWCVYLFNVEGRGTPAPWDPPVRFVLRGPYRAVRNPMMLGAFLVVGGEALLLQSRVLALYLPALMAVAHLAVTRWEEPHLARRFGPLYAQYRCEVPRWLPRLPIIRRCQPKG